MIDWRVILGALGGGITIALWLESRSLAAKKRQWRMMLVTAVLSSALFAWTAIEPWWQMTARLAQPPEPIKVDDGIFYQGPSGPTTLPAPRVLLLATAEPEPSPERPDEATNRHDSTYLRIPALNVAQPIVEVPLQNGRWDVSQLGGQVGWLSGTGANPKADRAMVFVGHMTFPTLAALVEGAFANLQYATYGTEVIYHQGGHDLVYEVTAITRIDPADIEQINVADGNSILLITCTDWDGNGRVYTNRLLVKASLVTGD